MPTVAYTLIIKNHKDSSKDCREDFTYAFESSSTDWGGTSMLLRSEITESNGFLRGDGALVCRIELEVVCKRRKIDRSVATDLRALLEEPGGTSDITITAGARSFELHRAILAARCDFFKTMFASGFTDGSSRELPLPDADPDALKLLLPFIYGGVLEPCPRGLLMPAAELADRLRLTAACDLLHERVDASSTPETVVEDMLWAVQRGSDALMGKLEALYLANAGDIAPKDIQLMAERNPQLLARLHIALSAKAK